MGECGESRRAPGPTARTPLCPTRPAQYFRRKGATTAWTLPCLPLDRPALLGHPEPHRADPRGEPPVHPPPRPSLPPSPQARLVLPVAGPSNRHTAIESGRRSVPQRRRRPSRMVKDMHIDWAQQALQRQSARKMRQMARASVARATTMRARAAASFLAARQMRLDLHQRAGGAPTQPRNAKRGPGGEVSSTDPRPKAGALPPQPSADTGQAQVPKQPSTSGTSASPISVA